MNNLIKKEFVNKFLKCSYEDMNTSTTISKYCRIAMFFDIGVSLGCIVFAIILLYISDYTIHLSSFLFCVGIFASCLSIHEYYLMKYNKRLMVYLIESTVNLIELQKIAETRSILQEKTNDWLAGLRGSIESAHLICKHQSAFLIITYVAGSSAIPKRVTELQNKLDSMDNDIKVHILHTPNDGKVVVPDEVLPVDSVKYIYEKDSSKWVSTKDD